MGTTGAESDSIWVCPDCGAQFNCKKDDCDDRRCQGLICGCEHDTSNIHGTTQSDPCKNAVCYHCNWEGRVPPTPKKLKPWEKKAIEAGWTPPEGWKS